ncbi:AAA family ATPase [candidate division KSB1 bacterium]|nr:AAA family ATPase [candidate division KSB1 bacterium]
MIINRIVVKAFKSIYDLDLELNRKMNVLIGANESGKTNILQAIESFSFDKIFDTSLTCQYSERYALGKCPEIALTFADISKEDRRNLVQISEKFKQTESFSIRKEGPELTDYHLLIENEEVPSINFKKFFTFLPKLLYFRDIPLLKNQVSLENLISTDPQFSTERNLLKIGAIEDYNILFEDSTRGRRTMDEAGRIITEQLRRVWSQESSIEIKLNVNGKVLYIDFSDDTTVLDTPESRSLGFRWYLSFYVNFAAQTFQSKAHEYIFLIDEPGIHLHPGGQKDLNKVLEELAIKNQLIFTTHSPFMINREHPERVLLVLKDKNGTKVDTEAYRENWKPLRKQINIIAGDLFFFTNPSLVLELPIKKRSKILDKLNN